MVLPASSTSLVPPSTFSTESEISCLISLAAAAERCARLRTSPATTAKPRPCSPARAASTAALRARMLVWKAMPSITLMMSTILREASLMADMVLTTSPTTTPPLTATPEAAAAIWLACLAFSEFCFTVEASCSMLEAVSSRLEACSSVRCDRSVLPAAISFAAVLMESAEILMPSISCLRFSTVALESSFSWPKVPKYSFSMVSVRSARDSALSTRTTSLRPTSLVSSSLFMPSPSVLKKPSLPFRSMRLDRSPMTAASTILATSLSTVTSAVRSSHSATAPRRSPWALMTGLAVTRRVRPPISMVAVWVLVRLASMRA
ncbi:hypothetical protein GALL_405830 [mine drainage metagenome]|uniref:Uncharacterized protein n=1 Tax=mine drainage metagenome TaxID=410659 RepID=A0A1J5QP32_9ZZZZ